MTLLTTINVATPNVTLMIEAKAIYRVRQIAQAEPEFVHE